MFKFFKVVVFFKQELINLNLKLFIYLKNNLNDIICDFHTFPKKNQIQNIVFVTTIFGALMWLCPRQGDWKNIQGFKCKHLNTITFIFSSSTYL
jgi:hypothetical protein